MIIKGKAAGAAGWWGKHLMRDDTNERAEVIEISGLLSDNVPAALREMEAIAAQSRCEGNFMYSVNINPRDNETLTPEQWRETVDLLEKNMQLEGHQRVVVEHEKDGRTHRHVIWNRVDVETLHVTDIGGNYYTHERTSRELEERFDLSRTPSLHGQHREEGRPDRPPELWEQRAAERSGIDPKAIKAELSELWRTTDSGKAFVAAVDERGYILATGDRRGFCIVDQAGDAHSLARRLEGVKAKEVAERLSDIDRANLPTVDEAREAQRTRPRETQSHEQPAAETAEIAIERDRIAAEQQKLEPTRPAELKQSLTPVEQQRTQPADKLKPAPAVTIPLVKEVASPIAREAAQAKSQVAWSKSRDAEVARVTDAAAPKAKVGGLAVADFAGSLGDFVLSLFGGASPVQTEAPNQVEQIREQRRAAAALDNIRDSIERGEGLQPSDLKNLTPTHLQNIAQQGDDYIRNLIERDERDRQRENDYGRERER